MIQFTGKQKKLLTIGGIAAVLVLVAAGSILLMGGKEVLPPDPAPSVSAPADVDVGKVPTPSATPEVSVPAVGGQETEAPASSDPVLNVEEESDVKVNISEFEKPAATPEPPKVADDSTLTNSEKPPVYEEEQVVVDGGKPEAENGQKKDGMIYIDGFGWIKDEGGGTVEGSVGTPGDELTGNMVGNMGS